MSTYTPHHIFLTMNKNRHVFELAEKWAKKNLTEIDVEGVEYDGGQRCQHVAMNSLVTKSNNVIVTLMFIPKSGVRIHFLNKRGSVYEDSTLGYLTAYNTHYKLAEFELNDLKDYEYPNGMNNLLREFKVNILDVLNLGEEYIENI